MKRAFVELQDECEKLGWVVLVELLRRSVRIKEGDCFKTLRQHTSHAVIVVSTGGDENYSRTVMRNESYDDCAAIVLRGLRASKVLPTKDKTS